MNQRTYVFNQETQKIEMRFSKADYQALPEETKKKTKRLFLLSGKRES